MSEIVRLAGVLVAAVLALAAAAAAMVPLALKQHRIDTPQVFMGSTTVFALPLTGGVPHPVLNLRGQWEFPTATRDGKALLLERPALSRTALWRVPLDGASPTRLADLDVFSDIAWSPDRSRYVTWSDSSLVMDRANGTRVRTLARENGGTLPTWDGAFISAERPLKPSSVAQQSEVDVWHADGSLAWRTTVTGPPGVASVTPDGKRVAVVRVHELDLVTPHGSRVLATDVEQPVAPAWTADGRALLYWDARGRLVLRTLESKSVHVVTAAAYPGMSYGLSADGKSVYLTRLNQAVSIPK
jgi:hypothetical protein